MSQRTREDAPEADKVCYDNDDNDDAMRLLSAHLMKNKWEFVSARLTITWSGKFDLRPVITNIRVIFSEQVAGPWQEICLLS